MDHGQISRKIKMRETWTVTELRDLMIFAEDEGVRSWKASMALMQQAASLAAIEAYACHCQSQRTPQ